MTTERPQTSMTNAELAAAIAAAHAQLSSPFSSTSFQTDSIVRAHLEALQREQRDRACARPAYEYAKSLNDGIASGVAIQHSMAYGESTMTRIASALDELEGIERSLRESRGRLDRMNTTGVMLALKESLAASFNSIEVRIAKIRRLFP